MFLDVNGFLGELERRGELARVAEPVNPHLEMAAVIDRACKAPGGGPGLLFERPTGASMPVAANLYGSLLTHLPRARRREARRAGRGD